MTVIHGFEKIRTQDVAEINSKATIYRHVKSGAELLSLENSDENKVFGVVFRTPPSDSTGVPHIMEHSVLCGSRKYQVKEPFVELMKGSLNTFLNAFTYPDKTCYPVASQNVQDFYNLIDVYLDAVFYPLITPYTLKQEGWHYELESPDAPMSFKGVVYNEMKGAFSSPDSVLGEISQISLFPDNSYGFISGGDPTVIPDLTYDQFKAFHDTYYHPSNARIYFYGDDDPEQRLILLDEYLKDFDRIPVNSKVSLQPPFSQPRRVVQPYEASESEEELKSYITLNWMLPEPGDAELSIGLAILDHILIGTSASPLHKVLIDSGLGEELAGQGLELGAVQMFYSTGMKGVLAENTNKVEDLILQTLEKLVRDGVDSATIAASMNTVEFALRENNTGRFPRGLVVMLRALETWLYDGDPLQPLCFEKPLEAVKTHLHKGERYFESLIEKYYLKNPHRVTVVLEPDVELAHRREAAEHQRLEVAQKMMTRDECEIVAAETVELKRRQEAPDTPEQLAAIPMLKLSDMEKGVRTIPLEKIQVEDSQILYHDLSTNGILYLDVGFNLHALPQEDLPYISLFGQALTEMGTHKETFVELLQRIGRSTGGISTHEVVFTVPGSRQSAAWLFIHGKTMATQAEDLLAILADVLSDVRLDDRQRFLQMALEEKASLESNLVGNGHRVINTRMKAKFDEAGWANEQMGGVSYLFFLRKLIQEVENDWPAVLAHLQGIRSRLFDRKNMICNVTVDGKEWTRLLGPVSGFMKSLPAVGGKLSVWQPDYNLQAEGLTIPAQVNYVGKAARLFDAGYTLHGSHMAITSYLYATWLWEKVRVQGGAYGGMCAFDQYSGVLSFLSYRDPNLTETLDIYDQTSQFLKTLSISYAELSKAIIGAIGDLDAYQLPDAKGFTSLTRHLLGISDEFRQHMRDQLLATRAADFNAFGEALEAVRKGVVVVLGAQDAIQSAEAENPGWLKIQKVL